MIKLVLQALYLLEKQPPVNLFLKKEGAFSADKVVKKLYKKKIPTNTRRD